MYSVLFIAVLYYDYCTTRVPVKSTGILVIERFFLYEYKDFYGVTRNFMGDRNLAVTNQIAPFVTSMI